MDYFSFVRNLMLRCKKLFIKDKNISLISNNCIAGFVCHDLNIRFNSPTINLMIHAYDYITFLRYLENEEDITNLIDTTNEYDDCPHGLLNGNVRIAFIHYNTFEEAKEKWLERVKRIDYDNLRIVYCQTSVREDIIEEFDKLDFKYKVALTNKKINDSCFVIKGFEKENRLGYIFGKYKLYGMNYYDQFNWVDFINGKFPKKQKEQP